MIGVSLRPASRGWSTISFASTLYLQPVLDLLLVKIPLRYRAEIKLGLQEALVNAAKHGNNLDPSKTVIVRFTALYQQHHWVISDQGSGFTTPKTQASKPVAPLPREEHECGRGLHILYQIFDQVHWNSKGTELKLCKHVSDRLRPTFSHRSKLPLLR